ncbi:MAG: trigger factor [Bacteroidales bacterium]|jgi:trigger factor
MKVTQKNIDDLTLNVTFNIDPSDYADKQKKILNDYRRKAEIKGFRKGMAPMGMIEKMHGRPALLDAVNGLISDGLNNYITDNKLNIIGEPLPSETEQKPVDWDNDTEFEFVFDLALAPKVEIKLSADDKIPYYEVSISEEEKNKYRSNLLKQYGQLGAAESVEEEDFIIADLIQGENRIEGTYISLRSIANEKNKKKFIGKKAGDEFAIDVNAVFENETDRAAMLKVKKEELLTLDPNYTVVIKEVKRFVDAEMTQDLFDKVYGAGVVNSVEEFDAKIIEKMKAEFAQESDYRFSLDARTALIEKAAIAVPEQFLKRWLFTANEGKFTMEEIEKDFALFLQDFRWQMIRQFITKEQKIEITRENLIEHAKKVASYQFAMYGMANAPEEQIAKYAESLVSNEKEGRRIYEKVEDELVTGYIKSVVSLDKRVISIDELQKMNN